MRKQLRKLQEAARERQRALQRYMTQEYDLRAQLEAAQDVLDRSVACIERCQREMSGLTLNPLAWYAFKL